MSEDKLNVMYIFNDSAFGGAGQSLLDILDRIKDSIHPVVIVRDNVDVENVFLEHGISCHKIHFTINYTKKDNISEEVKNADIKRSYEAAVQLVYWIKKENIHLIHINSSASYFAAIAALMAHVPYIWHIRELLKEQFNCQLINDEIQRSLYEQADKVITISDFVKQCFQDKYGIESVKIYDGLNVKRYKSTIKDNQYKNVFLAAGRITAEKGQWDIIRATEIIVNKGYCDIKVIIAGDGSERYVWALNKYITKKGLQDYICILPFQWDLSKLREEASYAITSSQNEALGRVTIEAMLSGHIVIGARSGGTTEIIGEYEERGFLYELGNVSQLANTMLKVMQFPSEKKDRIRRKAQVYAENIFDSNKYCNELQELYKEVVTNYGLKEHAVFCRKQETFLIQKKDKSVEALAKLSGAFDISVKWIKIRQKNHTLSEYFHKNHIKNIAIYGMAQLGRRLYDELESSDIEVKYLIDQNPKGLENILNFVTMDKDVLLDIDAIVVTVVSEEQEIINNLLEMGYSRIIGLSEIMKYFEEVLQGEIN